MDFIASHPTGIFLYTGGSKTVESTSAAVVCPALDMKKTFILNNWRTVLNAELKTILECILTTFEIYANLGEQFLICTADSLSSIILITNRNYKTDKLESLQIKSLLSSNTTSHHLVWTPGHENIEGNTLADAQTKILHNAIDLSNEKIHYSNFSSFIKNNTLSSWQEDWERTTQVKGRRLLSIQEHVSRKAWFENIHFSKKTTNILSRLRIGHGLFPAHLHRINLRQDDLCDCGEHGSLDHIVLGCCLLNTVELFSTLINLRIQLPTSTSLLLHEESFEVYSALKEHLILNDIAI